MRYVAGDFKLRLAIRAFDGFAHLFGFEVIEHDDVSPGLERGVQLFHVFDFDFDRHIRMQPEGFFDRLSYRTRRDNVVLFDQEGIR